VKDRESLQSGSLRSSARAFLKGRFRCEPGRAVGRLGARTGRRRGPPGKTGFCG